ncbi:MAG TPA: protein kinase [Gemmatimonadaceae bacterium]|nr:protein kinase [Gemmatimonadaceae bacterium]
MSTAAERLAASLGDRYKIERELGQGGMATVYLAEDARHHRKVAIKLLHPELSAILGTDRFLKEIELTANLQHPHILPLFDSGSADGLLFYVMPYVEGETLRGRLNRERQLPVDDAVRIAVDVADALDYAHRRGIIHRDIKPENILLLDGRPLVADFGIALAVEQAGGVRMTQTGISLGTPQYMAPEQAMGDKAVDQRADIYALGAVVFEMLAGDPPFTGPNTQAIVARIITEKPRSLTAIRDTVPHEIDEAVYSALQKLPADRPATAREFARMLTEKSSPFEFAPAERMTTSSIAAGVIGTALLFGLAGYAVGYRTHDFGATEAAPSRLAMMTPSLGGEGVARLHRQIALTPDGMAVVYVGATDGGENMLYYQRLDAETATPIEGSKGMLDPVISADGKRIYALISGPVPEVASIPITGGTPSKAPDDIAVGKMDRDGSVWFSFDSGSAQGPARYRFQQSLNRGKTALVTRAPHGTNAGPVYVADLGAKTYKEVMSDQVNEIRYGGGIAAFVKGDGTLWAARFDEKKAKLTEQPVQIASGVSLTGSGISQFALSKSGNLAYVPEEPRWLALVDRDGKMTYATSERRTFHSPRFSPDGRFISVDLSTAAGRDVWILSRDRGTMSRATFDHDGHDATWTPDGKYITYSSFKTGKFGLYRTTPGGGRAEELASLPNAGYTGEWFAPGDRLITTLTEPGDNVTYDIGIIENSGKGPIRPVVADEFHTAYPSVSPDGKWLAFVSDQSGMQQVYVRSLEGGGDKTQVSSDGGTEPVWSRDGRELFYRSLSPRGSDMMAVTVRLSPSFDVVSQKALFPLNDMTPAIPHANYDVSPDGRMFVMVRRSQATRVVVIQNLPAMLDSMRGSATP